MTFALNKVLTLIVLISELADGASLKENQELNLENIKIEEEVKWSKNGKRSPLELGFVSFELDHRQHDRRFSVPALTRHQNIIQKNIPIVSKSRTISTTSTISTEKGPKSTNHVFLPLGNGRVISPALIEKFHVTDPKIIVDHKELLVDHAADVVIDQKHFIVEHSPKKTVIHEQKPLDAEHSSHQSVVLEHPNTRTVIFEHKPVLLNQNEHETNVMIHSMPKTLILHHKPTVIVHHPKTVILGTSRTILLSPKNKIHEIIVHRHVPKTVLVHETIDDDRNIFRSHFGGFGVGMNYGGHGAGHGFHVPVI